jgi:hypothetical protein
VTTQSFPCCRPCGEPATVPHYDSRLHQTHIEILEKFRQEDRESLARAEAGLCIWFMDRGGECGQPAEPGLIYCRPHVKASRKEYGDEPCTIESQRAEIERVHCEVTQDVLREAYARREQAGGVK